MSDHLKKQLAESDYVVRRLSKIAIAARPSSAAQAAPADEPVEAPKVTPAKALAAAASAFSERKRAGGLAA